MSEFSAVAYENENTGYTGFLSSSGFDLSLVFMNISALVSGVSLSDNNEFSGTNTFTKEITANAGIIAPVASLTYTSNMIGYSNQFNGNGGPQAMTSLSWYTSTVTPFTFPSAGVWILCFNFQITTSTTAGIVVFCNGGLSTTPSATPTVFEITLVGGTYQKPTTTTGSGYCFNQSTYCVTIPTNTQTYYMNTRTEFTLTALTLSRNTCVYQITRIA